MRIAHIMPIYTYVFNTYQYIRLYFAHIIQYKLKKIQNDLFKYLVSIAVDMSTLTQNKQCLLSRAI
jgi:hypothetical protein